MLDPSFYRLQRDPLLPSSDLKILDKKIDFLREIDPEILSNEERYIYFQEMKFLMEKKKRYYMNHRNWTTAQEFQNEIDKYNFAMEKLYPFLADEKEIEKELKIMERLLKNENLLPLNFLKFKVREIFFGVPLEIKTSLERMLIQCSQHIKIDSYVSNLKEFIEEGSYGFKIKQDKENNLVEILF